MVVVDVVVVVDFVVVVVVIVVVVVSRPKLQSLPTDLNNLLARFAVISMFEKTEIRSVRSRNNTKPKNQLSIHRWSIALTLCSPVEGMASIMIVILATWNG